MANAQIGGQEDTVSFFEGESDGIIPHQQGAFAVDTQQDLEGLLGDGKITADADLDPFGLKVPASTKDLPCATGMIADVSGILLDILVWDHIQHLEGFVKM